MTDPISNLNPTPDIPVEPTIELLTELTVVVPQNWDCPVSCPYQSDNSLSFRAWEEMKRSSNRLFLPVVCTLTVALIAYSEFYQDGKRPPFWFWGLSAMVVVTSFHRQDVIIESSASVLQAGSLLAQNVISRKVS